MKYEWILFDADNTLFDFDRSAHRALKHTFADFELPFEEGLIDLYHDVNHQCWQAFEQGQMDAVKLRTERFRLFLERAAIQREVKTMSTAYLQHLAQGHDLITGAQALLDRLFSKFKLVIVTNGLKEVQRSRFQLAQFNKYFQAIIVSDEIGVSKPNPAFFNYAFEQIGHPAKTSALMVGDSLSSDIKGGNQYGLATCWYNPKQKENTYPDIQPTYELQDLMELENILHQ